jgi:hypothetical protein
MIATEDILFIMPKDREMQFPAMSALQRYVTDYEIKMQANCVTPTLPEYRMRYQVDISDEHWEFFRRLGIELKQDREEIGFPDSVIDLSDDRLLKFYNSEKHCSQICAAIAGVEAPPFPKVKLVKCGKWSGTLFCLDNLRLKPEFIPEDVVCTSTALEEMLHWQEVDGTSILTPIVIGFQSWQTYAIAAMGLPLVEILPRGRGLNWLSKWKNAVYRMIEEDRLERLPDALYSIQEVMAWVSSQAAAGKVDGTPMVPIESTAPSADSTSQTPSSSLEK